MEVVQQLHIQLGVEHIQLGVEHIQLGVEKWIHSSVTHKINQLQIHNSHHAMDSKPSSFCRLLSNASSLAIT